MESSALLPGETRQLEDDGQESLSHLRERYRRSCPEGTGVWLKIPFKALVKEEGTEKWVNRHYMVTLSDAKTAIETLRARKQDERYDDVLGSKERSDLEHFGSDLLISSNLNHEDTFLQYKGDVLGRELRTDHSMLTLRKCGGGFTLTDSTEDLATIEKLTEKMWTDRQRSEETEAERLCRQGWSQSNELGSSDHVRLRGPAGFAPSNTCARVQFVTAAGKDLVEEAKANAHKQF